jgi:hypothetical protein
LSATPLQGTLDAELAASALLAWPAVLASSAVFAWPALSAQLTDEPLPPITTLLWRSAGENIVLNTLRLMRSIICSVICIIDSY